MFNKTKKLGLAALLALGTISSANAIVLDSFDYELTMYVDADNSVLGASKTIDTASNPTAFGVVDYTLNLDSDTNTDQFGFITASASTSSGKLSFSAASELTGNIVLFYHNPLQDASPVVGDGLNFVQGGINDSFYIDVIRADQGLDVNIDVEDMSGNTSYFTFNIGATIVNTRLFLMFNNFIGTANFMDVKSVLATITSPNAADFTLDEVGLIPEPTTIAIFGLGLIGLAFGSRRKA